MSPKYDPWYSYFCVTFQHSRCNETEERGGCDCKCHELGDDEWWDEEPPPDDE